MRLSEVAQPYPMQRGQHAVLTLPTPGIGSWGGWKDHRAKGDRRPESLLRTYEPQPIIRSPVSLWILCFHFGWPAAGFLQFSPPLSPQRSPPFSPPFFQVSGLGHQAPGTGDQVQAQVQEICPLSSIQSSIHFGWPVAAPGGRWRAFFNSALHSVLNAVLHSVLSCLLTHLPPRPKPSFLSLRESPAPHRI